jgi:hypothetical protein
MDITRCYAIFSGALIMLPVMAWAVRCISGLVQEYQHGLNKYVSISKKITRLEVFLILAILVANVFCIGFNVHSAQKLMYRSGLVSSINFAFLSFGYHMGSLYKSSGLLLSDYDHIHYWAAGISITEANPNASTAPVTGRLDGITQSLHTLNASTAPIAGQLDGITQSLNAVNMNITTIDDEVQELRTEVRAGYISAIICELQSKLSPANFLLLPDTSIALRGRLILLLAAAKQPLPTSMGLIIDQSQISHTQLVRLRSQYTHKSLKAYVKA